MNQICDNCETAIHCAKYGCIPVRIGKPAQRTWVVLTDEEIDDIDYANWSEDYQRWNIKRFARAIEAKLKEKNA